MRRVALSAFPLILLLCGCSSKKEKIVGVWELESGVEPLTEATWEFTADGKVKVSGKLMGKPFSEDGTYSITGDTISFKMNVTKVTDKTRIVELTDSRLVMKDDGGSKEAVFKKRK